MLQNFGIWQIALILVIVLLLFGVGKLPQVGKGMGQAINEFKGAIGGRTTIPPLTLLRTKPKPVSRLGVGWIFSSQQHPGIFFLGR